MTNHAAVASRFPELVDAEPAVSPGVVQIVATGLAGGVLGVVLAAVAGLGLWGLFLSYVLAGNLGVLLMIARSVRAV